MTPGTLLVGQAQLRAKSLLKLVKKSVSIMAASLGTL